MGQRIHKRLPMYPLYVLIGGASSRFGVDKAWFPIDGEPWAAHVGGRLSVGGDFVLVGRLPEAAAGQSSNTFAASCIPDAAEGEGPLAGVLAALEHARATRGPGVVALASCDLVRPEPAWLEPLAAALRADGELEVAAYTAAGRWQPFPCLAHTRWGDTLRRLLRGGVRSWQQALRESRAHAEPWLLDDHGPPQANTPAELARRLRG